MATGGLWNVFGGSLFGLVWWSVVYEIAELVLFVFDAVAQERGVFGEGFVAVGVVGDGAE